MVFAVSIVHGIKVFKLKKFIKWILKVRLSLKNKQFEKKLGYKLSFIQKTLVAQ
jgi:hypothetical protein